MKILSLEAQNIKRLRAVSITPDGNVVAIDGVPVESQDMVAAD